MDPKQCFVTINVVEIIAVEIIEGQAKCAKGNFGNICLAFSGLARVWVRYGPGSCSNVSRTCIFKAAYAQNAEVVNPSLDSYAP